MGKENTQDFDKESNRNRRESATVNKYREEQWINECTEKGEETNQRQIQTEPPGPSSAQCLFCNADAVYKTNVAVHAP